MKFLLYLLFCLSLTAHGEDFSVAKLEKKYKSSTSFEADFVQEVYQATLAKVKTSKGNIRLKKPGSIRWETYNPEASIMVSNGHKLWYYTPNAGLKGKGQVIEHSANELMKQPLFQILTGTSGLEKEFSIVKTEAKDADSSTELTLKPKIVTQDLELVRLKIDDNYLISEIFLKNKSGNTTKISLLNQHLNATFPAVLFNFVPPAGVEVLKN
jgi:chaperone LolA